jgi:hypothetical protein
MSKRLTSDEWEQVYRAISNELNTLYAKEKDPETRPSIKFLVTRNIGWLESARAKLQGVDAPEVKQTRLQKHGIRLAEAVIEERKS